jgi:hypothetical protein
MCVSIDSEAALRLCIHLELESQQPVDDHIQFTQRAADTPRKLPSSPELPQAVCVVLTSEAVRDSDTLAKLSGLLAPAPKGLGAELLGIKTVEWLPAYACAEACPYPAGHPMREPFIQVSLHCVPPTPIPPSNQLCGWIDRSINQSINQSIHSYIHTSHRVTVSRAAISRACTS